MKRPSSIVSLFVERNRRFIPVAAVVAGLCIVFFYLGGSMCGVKSPLEFANNAGAPLKAFKPCSQTYQDFTPCMDPNRWNKFYDHQSLSFIDRHCPSKAERLACLVPPTTGYRIPIRWPASLDESWYENVPYEWINKVKSKQHWMERQGDKWSFTGGGTMFPDGVEKYLDAMEEVLPPLKDGTIRTAIDTGCGVASWGGHLFKRGVLVLSVAPRDNHEAQVQFALERGIPAMLGVIASQRLPFPSASFDLAHCSRCLIPWTGEGAQNLLEVARILRPGGFWVLSGPPVNWQRRWMGWNTTIEKQEGDLRAISDLMASICFREYKIEKDFGIWQKISDSDCLKNRPQDAQPPICEQSDPSDADAAWYVPMKTCVTPLPDDASLNRVLPVWPARVDAVPPRLSLLKDEDEPTFEHDRKLWAHRVQFYKEILPDYFGTDKVRNVMDMNAHFGGFAAALVDSPVWVMNVVSPFAENTLGLVFERGLIGTYHDWCEAFSTYPRTYDLLHAAGLFSADSHRCDMADTLIEMDRILRPSGIVIVRDLDYIVEKIEKMAPLVRWSCRTHQPDDPKKSRGRTSEPPDLILVCTKEFWTL